MERPLKEVKLPKSGYIAKLATFLTRGEDKSVKSKRFEGGQLEYINDEAQIKNVPVDFAEKQNDALVLAGLKQLIDTEGKSIEISSEVIDNLQREDFNVLLLEMNKIYAGGEDEVSKKK